MAFWVRITLWTCFLCQGTYPWQSLSPFLRLGLALYLSPKKEQTWLENAKSLEVTPWVCLAPAAPSRTSDQLSWMMSATSWRCVSIVEPESDRVRKGLLTPTTLFQETNAQVLTTWPLTKAVLGGWGWAWPDWMVVINHQMPLEQEKPHLLPVQVSWSSCLQLAASHSRQ